MLVKMDISLCIENLTDDEREQVESVISDAVTMAVQDVITTDFPHSTSTWEANVRAVQ